MAHTNPVIAVYPGTFDPMTLGHEDVIRRAIQLFERVIVAVAAGHHKKAMFTLAERIDMARHAVAEYPQVEVESFSGCCATSSSPAAARPWCAACAR
jgi:pantetheine-phosphate adenylyltransferase